MDTFLAGVSCGIAGIVVAWLLVGHIREYRRRGRQNVDDHYKIVVLQDDVKWHKCASESKDVALKDARDKLKAAGIK
jgi:hypothetical protein